MVKQFVKDRLGNIIFLVIVAIFVIWGVFSIQRARANAITYTVDYEAPEGNVDSDNPGTYVSIASTDRFELFYNEANGAIQVKDLANGYLWKGICDEEVYPELEDLNKQWIAYLKSPITLTYNDLQRRDSSGKKVYAGKDCDWLETEYIDNGVAATYGFTAAGIFVRVEYTLDENGLVVRVPVDKIREESKFAVTTIELLPYLGAAGNEVSGYLFYPDGSGAITTYEKVDTRPANVSFATYYTYTHRTVNFQTLWQIDYYDRYTAAMPVYGIKNNDNALFAIFTEGAENAGIIVNPSGNVVDLNHIGYELYMRNIYNVNMYSVSTGIDTSLTGGIVQRIDKTLIPEDKVVHFYLLNGDEANYSGMAKVYREYLLKNGMLNDAIEPGVGYPLALRLLMGATKEGMIFDEYVTMTTFEQVQEIMDRLNALGITDMNVVLQAWMSDYDNYEYWGPASKLGGTSGLKSLNQYLASHANSKVYLETDFAFATNSTSGISEKTDIVYDGLGVEVSTQFMDGTAYYLVNPLAAYKRNLKLLSKLEKYDLLGVAYSDIGQYAYADFNETASYTKAETVAQFRELLNSTASEGRGVASLGANQYVYGYADYMYLLREDCYGLSITDYSVPFLQMVLSGMITYSTDGAGNLAYDLQTQKLKWIEYGAIPYFRLTYESALKLRNTGYDTLFSSTYDDWEGIVVDTYLEFKDNLSCVYGEQMVDHRILSDDLVRVEYGNGVVIYVNYGNSDAVAEGVTVPAKDYVVVGGGEQ